VIAINLLLGFMFHFITITANGPPAAASAGFTCLMFSFPLLIADLINAYIRKSPALLAAGLLAVVICIL